MRPPIDLRLASERALGLALSRLAVPDPVHLGGARQAVERRFGSGVGSLVSVDRLEHVVAKLRKGTRDGLARSDRYVLAHALSQPSAQLKGRSVLSDDGLCSISLAGWERESKAGKMRASHWRGLFHSFLQAEEGAGTERLRKLLKASWPGLQKEGRVEMPWMRAIGRHEGLLGSRPCEPYIEELLRGKRDLLEDLKGSIGVPAASWFWPELTNALLASIEKSSETEFKARIPGYLNLAVDLPGSPDAVLAATLDRYARCQTRPPHQALLRFALDVWKSPQLTRNVLWGQVSAQAKQMICGWLALEDLEDFYRLCQDSGQVDERRLRYWLRFKEQIVFSQIVLGAEFLYSSNPDIREFRERKKGRLAGLTSTTGGNNAIIMQIGDWVFVEFSQSGNACYPYQADRTPFDIGESRYAMSELKDRAAVKASDAERLVHMSQWEQDSFDPFLRRCGIHPDASSTKRVPDRVGGVPRRESTPPDPQPRGARGRRDEAETPIPHPLTIGLIRGIRQAGGAVVDHRSHGGPLWVLGSGFDDKTYKGLKALGFRAKIGKGLYL